jgi:hypothetical protein
MQIKLFVDNRNGMVEKIWRGNAWTPAEVSEAIRAETE